MKKLNKILPIATVAVAAVPAMTIVTSCNNDSDNLKLESLTDNTTAEVTGVFAGNVSNQFRLKGASNLHYTKLSVSATTPSCTGKITSATVEATKSWIDIADGTFTINFYWTCNEIKPGETGTFSFSYQIVYKDEQHRLTSKDFQFTIAVRC